MVWLRVFTSGGITVGIRLEIWSASVENLYIGTSHICSNTSEVVGRRIAEDVLKERGRRTLDCSAELESS